MGIPNLDILIVDDNSPDGTSQIIQALQKTCPNLFLLSRKLKKGLGSAYLDGFEYAAHREYDMVIQMDGDLSHDISALPNMLELLGEYDLVIGSRYTQGGRVRNWRWGRIFLSRVSNMFAKLLLGLPFHDLTSGFKVLKMDVIKTIDFSTIFSQGYVFQIEVVYRAFLKKFHITEYPIVFRGRIKGKSKISLGIILEAISKILVMAFGRLKRQY